MFDLNYLRNFGKIVVDMAAKTFPKMIRSCDKFLIEEHKIVLGLVFAKRIEKFLRVSDKDLVRIIPNLFTKISCFFERFWEILTGNATEFGSFGRFGKIIYEFCKYPLYILSCFSDEIRDFLASLLTVYLTQKLSIPDKVITDAVKYLPKEILERINIQSIPLFKKVLANSIVFIFTSKLIHIIVNPLLRILPRKTDMMHGRSLTYEEITEEWRLERDFEQKKEKEKMEKPFDDPPEDNSVFFPIDKDLIKRQMSRA